jgi:hypothetical protein
LSGIPSREEVRREAETGACPVFGTIGRLSRDFDFLERRPGITSVCPAIRAESRHPETNLGLRKSNVQAAPRVRVRRVRGRKRRQGSEGRHLKLSFPFNLQNNGVRTSPERRTQTFPGASRRSAAKPVETETGSDSQLARNSAFGRALGELTGKEFDQEQVAPQTVFELGAFWLTVLVVFSEPDTQARKGSIADSGCEVAYGAGAASVNGDAGVCVKFGSRPPCALPSVPASPGSVSVAA